MSSSHRMYMGESIRVQLSSLFLSGSPEIAPEALGSLLRQGCCLPLHRQFARVYLLFSSGGMGKDPCKLLGETATGNYSLVD